MSHKKNLLYNNHLINSYTGAPIQQLNTVLEDNKYYAAVVMCGHCGRDYFLPIMFPFWCKQEEINIVARQIARVKRGFKECILCSGEIDPSIYRLIDLINDSDGYLKPAFIGYDDGDVEERKVVLPKAIQEQLRNQDINQNKNKKREECLSFKTADMYADDMILQKAFAPRIAKSYEVEETYKGKKYKTTKNVYSFPTKVKLSDILDDYLTASTFKYGICRKRLSIISLYYQLYGPNNVLGIKYNKGIITCPDENGQTITFEVSEGMRKHIEEETTGSRYKAEKKDLYQEIVDTYGTENQSTSGLERFKRRLNKTNTKAPEPGEEE